MKYMISWFTHCPIPGSRFRVTSRWMIAICFFLIGTTLRCGPNVVDLDEDLPPVRPEGLDAAAIARLVSDIRTGLYPDIHSLLIMRHGELVVEEYFNGASADALHTMQSVTKSFTSALVGIAIANGVLTGVHEPVLDFFPQWREALSVDPWRVQQRIEDILTMRTGTDYVEGYPGSPHDQLNRLAVGWDRFWLERPMVRQPGVFWQYDSGGVITLSSIIKARTGSHADVYAETHLFQPLGITESRWYKNQENHPHMGGGLSLRSRDMIKLGQLFLQHGRWGTQQVIPEAWVTESFRQRVTFTEPHGRYIGYGYLWWILPKDPNGGKQPIYTALGFMGQHVFVIPDHDMVVAVTAGALNGDDMNRPSQFLYTDILPAVRD